MILDIIKKFLIMLAMMLSVVGIGSLVLSLGFVDTVHKHHVEEQKINDIKISQLMDRVLN